MIFLHKLTLVTGIVFLTLPVFATGGEHPRLILTKDGVAEIRRSLGTAPLLDETVARVKSEVDAEIELGIDTPTPLDYSGGYTHERHKRNFFIMQKAGVLFQILEDEKYAKYVRDMLFQYEAMYRDLPLHPKTRSYARGKIFWQCLNDANWLVYASQAYDTIYDYLSDKERAKLEANLFRPFADHISVDSPQFFNRVHNHSTWGNAAVGMIGLVMGDDALVERALYGIPFDEIDASARDDDGGFIYSRDGKAGFLANLEEPFSPDGYYTEGPYYQRYAMYPFLIFAQALHNARPDLRVFEKRNGVLLKAVDALLNLSDADGEFFPLNDGQKGMSWRARELVTAVDIAYLVGGRDPKLLGIAQLQGEVLLDDAGIAVASDVRDGKARAFEKYSVNYSDGPDGTQGGVAVLRHGDEDLALVFKYTAQGLSHGHYDKLSYSLYEQGDEVLQDYGLARFVNIEQKGGGNYLKENTTWAKQTIAHNTLTMNETSHFQGKYEIGSQHHSNLGFFGDADPDVQVASATESNAYPGTELQRTVAVIGNEAFEKPFVLDIFKVVADGENQYDLPFYFMGQVLEVNFEYEQPSSLKALGEKSGYQHLYLEGKGKAGAENTRFSWMDNGRFYTLTSVTTESDELLFTRIGANDPAFNLRRDAALMIRRNTAGNTVFVTVIEPHGGYSPVSELAVNATSSIAHLALAHDDERYTAVSIESRDGRRSMFLMANRDSSSDADHELEVSGQAYRWTGPFRYFPERNSDGE
jgi:hypothetical protein